MKHKFWWRRHKELDEELRNHFEMAVRERIERGEDSRRAREAALREFGNAGLVRETTRDTWGWRRVEEFAHDARYTLRLLRKNPAFTLIAVLTLALGIGSNAVIFSVINGLYLHPKGMPDPSHIFTIRVNYTKLNLRNIVISPPDFRDVRDSRQIFSTTAAEDQGGMTFPGPEGPVRVETAQITWEWFNVFNARPLMGRVFSPEEDQPHANQEAILSYAAWRNLFGGDPEIIGKTINLNRADYRIVGVMGQDFDWPRRTEVWIPMGMPPESFADDNYFNEALFVVARARPDVTPAQAEAYARVLTHRLIASHPETTYPSDSGWGMTAIPLTEYASGDLRAPMLILLVAVGFLLLIACSNIGGLMLAKSAARTKEFALRIALGAGRSDLLRQAITEGLLLTAIGAVVGVGAAYLGLDALIRIAPGNLPLRLHASLDGHVLAFAVLLTMIAGIFLGLVPLSHVFSREQADILRSDARSFTPGHGRQRLRQLLVIGQVALALVLLVGAGLMLKSLGRISRINPGFDPAGLMTASIQLPEEKYNSDEKQIVFYRSVADRLAGLPGVESAALALPIPFSGFAPSSSFNIENRPMPPGDPGPHSDLSWVSPQFFATLRIPLLQGRYFTDQDSAASQPVVIVDENLARQYWPNENPVGMHLRRGNKSPWATIVGVVGHVMLTSLAGDSGKGVCYYPLLQQPVSQAFVIVKTRTGPARLGPSIRSTVAAVDAGQPVDSLESMDDYVSSSLGPQQISVSMLGTFSILALFLSALGLYGVISYEFAQRTREIGIRMSLGAQRQEVWRLVVAEGMRLALAGVLAGALGAALLARYLASELYGVSALDPATFAWTSLVLAAIALMACLVPAVRATRVDPIVALRYE